MPRVAGERLLEELPVYQAVLEKFTTKELISQAAFSAEYEVQLREGKEATGVFSRWECWTTVGKADQPYI